MMKVRSILVSQPAPSAESSPYLELIKKEKIFFKLEKEYTKKLIEISNIKIF